MATRESTQPGVPPPSSPYALEVHCAGRHERTAEELNIVKGIAYGSQRRLDGLTGIDGGKGRVGTLEDDMRKTAEILEKVVASQEGQRIKLAAIVTVATLIGGALAAALVSFITGAG